MRKKRALLIILCVLILCFGFGCKNKQDESISDGNNIYTYFSSPEEMYDGKKNVYIGKIIKTDEIKKVSLKEPDGSYVTAPFVPITVEVQQVFKGDFKRNTQVNDLVFAQYQDFLEEGSTYVLMTGVDYFQELLANSPSNIYSPGNIYEAVKIVNETEIEIFESYKYIKNGKAIRKFMEDPPKDLKELVKKINSIRMKYHYTLEEVYDLAENVYIGKIVEFGEAENVKTFDFTNPITFQHITVEVQKVYKGDFKENTQVDDMVLEYYDRVFQYDGTYLFMTRKDYSKESLLHEPMNLYEVARIEKDNKIETCQIDETLLFRQGDSVPADFNELISRLEKCRS